MDEVTGEPLYYSGPRFAIWALLTVAFFIDWLFHFKVQVKKKPLFLVIWGSLVLQLLKEGFSFALDVMISDRSDLPEYADFWFSVLDAVSEVAELAVIVLISTGWGVIYTTLSNKHRIFVTGGVITLLIVQLMITLGRSRTSSYAVWGLLWLVVAFAMWFYIITMISQNSKILAASLQTRNSIPLEEVGGVDEEGRGEEGGEPRVTLGQEEIGQIDVNSPNYLKSILYKRFTYLIVLYILVQFGAEVVVAIAVVMVQGVSPAVYWLATVPRDLVEIGLFFSLCYLFRLREDNPYFALPSEEIEDDSPNFQEYHDQADLVTHQPQSAQEMHPELPAYRPSSFGDFKKEEDV